MTKKTKITIASIIFLAVFIADIWAVTTNNRVGELLFKPLLLTTLAIVYLVSVKKANFWMLSALFFSFWGDVLLLFKEQYFVFGLASFLVAHILYIKITAGFLKKVSVSKILIATLPFVVFFVLFLTLIFDNLGDMKIPVIIYGITISSFGAVTLLNYISYKTVANGWLFLGAVIFISSDAMIAIHRFYEAKEIYGVLIMTTYVVAQYLICKAIIAKQKVV